MTAKRWLPLLVLSLLIVVATATLVIGITGLTPSGAVSDHAVAAQRDDAPPTTALSSTIDNAVRSNRFSLVDFEFDSIFNRWLGAIGDFVTGRAQSGDQADNTLQRYFDLTATITRAAPSLDADGRPDPLIADQIAALRDARATLENRAERILESRIADAFRDAGFSRDLPLFDGQQILWPPIDVELDRPPRVLAVSPRDEIRLRRTVLLDPDLSAADVLAIEAAVEADGRYSALVDTIGGVAAYPAIVRDSRSYPSTVDTIAHEWVHHYLFFYPLGLAFFDSNDLRTINETVADIVAAEVAARVLSASPQLQPAAPPPTDRSASDAILRRLRIDVDDLIADGQIEQAERLMETVRLELAELGRDFRRINQAFFAFNGVYGNTPASTSPIGPLLATLRAGSLDLIDFVTAVREIDTLPELQALVESGPG